MDVDTIASVSTAPGVGAIAVVRLSGPSAVDILRTVAPALDASPEPRRATLVDLHDPKDGAPLDRAVATFFPSPASYTGEDVIELSCHGGWLGPAQVLAACVAAGAREAEPGEFTRRAYLRGKIDLVQAEAVADLIEARSRALHRAALGQLEKGLSARIGALREGLVHLEGLLAHHIDFPEEDDPPVPIEEVLRSAGARVVDLEAMLATAPEGELLREGALAVLAGRPNVGKSSLYNALLGEERAIVTEEPGTTRDALEVGVQLGGFPFRLVDTAGLRDPEGRIEALGIEVTRKFLERADLVLLCVEASEGVGDAEMEFLREVPGVPVVLVETKVDLVGQERGDGDPGGRALEAPTDRPGTQHAAPEKPAPNIAGRLRLSVLTGQGLDQVRQLLPELAYSAVVHAAPDAPVITRRRHARALERARDEVEAFRQGLMQGLPAEVAAAHLRAAETALEEILGVISADDVLDVVFREFCVGK